MKFSEAGIPIVSLRQKLIYLMQCIQGEAWEDVAGHLCDLLEHTRKMQNSTMERHYAAFQTLEQMVSHYGRNKTPIENTAMEDFWDLIEKAEKRETFLG